jgi:DEAD/DEAH box helicase domain-containing protein
VRWFSNEVLGEGKLDLPSTQLRTMGYWLSVDSATVERLRDSGHWNNDPNNYGPNWPRIRKIVLMRDGSTCQACGAVESERPFHVHHKIPLRSFLSIEQANQLDNLVTLCPPCHQRAEMSILMRSGLAGLAFVLHQLAPLSLMCDAGDLGRHSDPLSPLSDKQPTVILYDMVPAGIGLADALFDQHDELMQRAFDLVTSCGCQNGCPSCVGPAGANGVGGKEETLALLAALCGMTRLPDEVPLEKE